MKKHKWQARTKRDLIIEVWETLDCETVGATELEAIEQEVRERFGDGAVESHAVVARILADEGAELRHPEVLELYVLQQTTDPYADLFRDVLNYADLDTTADSINRLEKLRKAFADAGDKTGLHRVRELALKGKRLAQDKSDNESNDAKTRAEMAEIAEWFGVWLRQHDVFDTWLDLRRNSKDFIARFGGSGD